LTKEEFAQELVKIFPEKLNTLIEHVEDYNELLGHLFFSEAISVPLFALLKDNVEIDKIERYCHFIEEMWSCGTEEVVNIVDVTILESLSDNKTVWENFGAYITKEFKDHINHEVLVHNLMMSHVQRL